MATLTVWKFETPDGAQKLADLLQTLQKQQLITVVDAATVTWPQGGKPKTKQLHNMAGIGALDGAFWGMLFGLLFFIPFLGLAIGAAMGGLAGYFSDVGIDDNFIKEVRGKVTEGTSALFVMTQNAVMDKVEEQVKASGLKPELIASNISKEQEDQLTATFGTPAQSES